MNLDKSDYIEYLFLRYSEGSISKKEMEDLNAAMLKSESLQRQYLNYSKTKFALSRLLESAFLKDNDISSFNNDLFELAEYERNALAIEIPKEESPRKPIQKVVYPPREKRKVNKFNIFVLAAGAAAMLFIVLFVKFAPENPSHVEVATLKAVIDAKWFDSSVSFKEGQRLYSNEVFSLERGLVKIQTDGEVNLIIEGPAEFILEKNHQIFLESGRLVAQVNGISGEVFVVRSPYSCVVDYGTEFGVVVDVFGLKVDVFKGRVDVRKGVDPLKFSQSLLLKAGQGASVSQNKLITKKTVDAGNFVLPGQFDIRYEASRGSGYAQWQLLVEWLQQDPSLVAHYTFVPDPSYPEKLVNKAISADQSTYGLLGDGKYEVPLLIRGRWPQKKAMQFNRKDHHVIRVPADPSLCIAGDITLAVWMKLNPTDNHDLGGHILSCRAENGVNYQLGYFKQYDRKSNRSPYRIQFLRRKAESAESHSSSDEVVIDTQQWHFLVVTHDLKRVRYYIDGKLINEAPFDYSNQMIPGDLYIGDAVDGKYDYSNKLFHGLLDEVMIFKRALSGDEIKYLYQSGKP